MPSLAEKLHNALESFVVEHVQKLHKVVLLCCESCCSVVRADVAASTGAASG